MPLITAITVGGAVTYVVKKKLREGDDEEEEVFLSTIDVTNKTKVEFLHLERTLAVFEKPICTVTFFEGNPSTAAEFLRNRVANIVYRNPWLGGWLAYDPNEEGNEKWPHLWYDESSDELAPNLFQAYEPGEVPFSYGNNYRSYYKYNEIFEPHDVIVKSNSDILHNPKEFSLFRVSLIPDAESPNDKFALVVSMSHLCGDAHTYYKIFQMLSSESTLETLNPKRKEDFEESVSQIQGEKEVNYLFSDFKKKGVSLKELKQKIRIFQKAKKEGTIETYDDQERSNVVFTVSDQWLQEPMKQWPELSPNDIITQWLYTETNADVGLMPYNFRSRKFDDAVPPCTELDAGNYHNPIPYSKKDYASPQLIRKSLETARRNSWGKDELPPFAATTTTFAISVNWSTFHKQDLVLPDACTQVLHVPYHPVNLGSLKGSGLTFAIIFRPKADKVGIVMSTPKRIEPLTEACGIVDEYIAKF